MRNLISDGEEEDKDGHKDPRLKESIPDFDFRVLCLVSWVALERVVTPQRIRR